MSRRLRVVLGFLATVPIGFAIATVSHDWSEPASFALGMATVALATAVLVPFMLLEPEHWRELWQVLRTRRRP